MRTTLFAVAAALLIAAPVTAECPCIPLTHLWAVKTCTDWNCAQTELLLASGDPQVMAIPVAMNDTRWLVVRRFTAGAAVDTTNDPFQLQQYDRIDDAIPRYALLSRDFKPHLLTAPDGQVLVITLKQAEPKRRAVSH
jgi:hypothetical protein